MTAETKPTLADRVLQFQLMELPGQPMMMHMGTNYLVSDLWASHKEMAEALRSIANTYDESYQVGCLERLIGDKARAALSKAGG